MTTGEWLASLSTAPEGSTMLTVVSNLEGTYPVLAPVESFEVDMEDKSFTADLDIITTTADISSDEFEANVTQDELTADINMENYDVDTTN